MINLVVRQQLFSLRNLSISLESGCFLYKRKGYRIEVATDKSVCDTHEAFWNYKIFGIQFESVFDFKNKYTGE